ncbi:MAG: hypothetical protein AAF050_01875 [Cyanobacteria bacterium J06649_5]
MTYACDVCLSVCRSPDVAVLSGWWGSREVLAATARKSAGYQSVKLEEEASLSSHVCRQCMDQCLSKRFRANAEKSRSALREERRAKYPNEHPFVTRRKTAPVQEDVICDCCEESCLERYVEVRSEWQDAEQAHQVIHLCDRCYESHLLPLLVDEVGINVEAVIAR